MGRILVVIVLLASSCASGTDAGDLATITSGVTNSATQRTAPPNSDPQPTNTDDGSTPGSDSTTTPDGDTDSEPVSISGAPLNPAGDLHREGEPGLGLPAPKLSRGDLTIPSSKPTIVLSVVGSCDECAAAAESLSALLGSDEVNAVLLTSTSPPDAIDSLWTVVVDRQAAEAYGGRDRPTALVVGSGGALLSKQRPFNQSGVLYDIDDLAFALDIAANQNQGGTAGPGPTPLRDGRSGQLPDSFFAIKDDFDMVEVSSSDGSELNRVAGPEVDDEEFFQAVVEVVPIPGSDQFIVNECCEPAAGAMYLVGGWDGVAGDKTGDSYFSGWEVSTRPDGAEIAVSGYTRFHAKLDREILLPLGTSNGSNPDVAWLRDRLGVVFLHRNDTPAVAEIIELDRSGRAISRRSFALAGPASAIDVNAAGDLVVVAAEFGSGSSRGEIYDVDTAAMTASFGLEDGTANLDYDVSGQYLIYVDGEGVARWQGAGQSGVLGTGYINANW